MNQKVSNVLLSLAARPSSPPGNEITETRKGEEGLAELAQFLVA